MISHHHRTIFVHVPKCGGQSIEHMFLDDLGLTWANREPLLLRANNISDLGPPRLAHLLARDYVRLGHISQKRFEEYFKFVIVRNPYDRTLSFFNYLERSGPRTSLLKAVFGTKIAKALSKREFLNLDEFIFEYLPEIFSHRDERGEKSNFWFVRKQADYVFDTNGALLLDQVIRLEELKEKCADLRATCGVKSSLRHVNKSVTKATQQSLLPKHLDKIEELYKEDFELFGYNARSS